MTRSIFVQGGEELVSVIVPAYNAGATIAATLESALAQTYGELEVVVVDDGSTDRTAAIVNAFVARDHRVRLLRQANAGVAAARNLAVDRARGAYVAPLDADDLWHPEKIALQVAAMRQGGSRVGVVHCWWHKIDVAGRLAGADRRPYPHEGDVSAALILGNLPANGSVPLIRRACLAEVGGYDSGLRAKDSQGCEDLMLYLELARRWRFALVPRFLVGYRTGVGNMSSDAQRITRSEAMVLKRARERYPELPARLFRMAEARAQLRATQRYFRSGMPLAAVIALADALRRDPMAAVYKLMEKAHEFAAHRRRHAPDIKGQRFLDLSPTPAVDGASAISPFLQRYARYAAASTEPGTEPRAFRSRS